MMQLIARLKAQKVHVSAPVKEPAATKVKAGMLAPVSSSLHGSMTGSKPVPASALKWGSPELMKLNAEESFDWTAGTFNVLVHSDIPPPKFVGTFAAVPEIQHKGGGMVAGVWEGEIMNLTPDHVTFQIVQGLQKGATFALGKGDKLTLTVKFATDF